MFAILYGKTAAGLYAQAAGQNAQARQLYNASADTYYKANDAAAYDDWVRARNHWYVLVFWLVLHHKQGVVYCLWCCSSCGDVEGVSRL